MMEEQDELKLHRQLQELQEQYAREMAPKAAPPAPRTEHSEPERQPTLEKQPTGPQQTRNSGF
jgi:hypothetical protein